MYEVPVVPPSIEMVREKVTNCNINTPGGVLSTTDGLDLYLSYMRQNPQLANNIHFNHWLKWTMKNHISTKSYRFYDKKHRLVEMRLTNPIVYSPQHPLRKNKPLYPIESVRLKCDYECTVYAIPALFNVATGEKIKTYLDPIKLFTMPIPVRCDACNLSKLKSDTELQKVGHDPRDPGTYFIIKGNKMMMPLIEKLRLYQIHVVPPKKEKFPHARQIFMVDTGTVLMKAVKILDTDEIALEIFALGPIQSGSTANKPKKNYLNVLNVAALIDFYYRTSSDEHPLSLSVPGYDIEPILRDALKRYMPYTDHPNAWELVYNEYQATVEAYRRTSRDVIFGNVIKWLGVTNLDDVRRSTAITQFIARNIFPTAHNKVAKINMLANLTCRLLCYITGITPATDLNKWSYRKLDTCASEQARKLRLGLTYAFNAVSDTHGEASINNIKEFKSIVTTFTSQSASISTQLMTSFKTADFGKSDKTNSKRQNKFQTTERLDANNLAQLLTLLNKIHVDVYRKTKNMELRTPQTTQLFIVCPENTPDNEQCGLVKFLTPSSVVTLEIDRDMVIEVLHRYGIVKRAWSEEHPYPVTVNGYTAGFCNGVPAQREIAMMRRHRRYDGSTAVSMIPDHVSVVFNEIKHLEISTEDGRIVYPVSYIENNELIADKYGHRGKSFDEQLREGCVGWLDPYETEYAKTVAEPSDLIADTAMRNNTMKEILQLESSTNRTSEDERTLQVLLAEAQIYMDWPNQYCPLHPIQMFDVSVASLPFNEHEQSCRVSYGVKMFNQAKSLNPVAAQNASGKYLISPTRPLIDTGLSAHFGMNEQPNGKNIIIGMITTKASQEDAMEICETLRERFAYIRRTKKHINLKALSSGSSAELKLSYEFGMPGITGNKDPAVYNGIGRNGMPSLDREYKEGDCIIGVRLVHEEVGKVSDSSVFLGPGESGRVVSVTPFSSDGGNIIDSVTVILEEYRLAAVGDKFATRHGQKYTVGACIPRESMYYISSGPYAGTILDSTLNPHCIGSRMTTGFLIEMLLGIVETLDILQFDGTSFEKSEDIAKHAREILRQYGCKSNGTVTLTRGDTGEEVEGEIFIGPMYMMKLCHIASEKMQGSGGGDKDLMNQAKKGRKTGGAVRFGELEIMIALAYGATTFVNQRTSEYSDAIKIPICTECMSFVDSIDSPECIVCGSKKGYATVVINFIMYTIISNLLSIGIRVKLQGKTIEDRFKEMLDTAEQQKEFEITKEDISYNYIDYYQDDDDDNEIIVEEIDADMEEHNRLQEKENFGDIDNIEDYLG